ncbi:uncharacterized protein [Palaemon carinicauda]|uniref:uncharacterized protein n=1 Tax=Palaemon carinicauda TaxID=392227 RepID=UPI0035B6333F
MEESEGEESAREVCSIDTRDIPEGDNRASIHLRGVQIKRVDKFKYLGSFVNAGGGMEDEVKHRVQAGWNNWRAPSVVLCDKRIPLRLKGKFHKTIVRTAMLYETETASMRKTEEKKMDVAKMTMLR